jgi:hypothetical protein
MKSKKSGRKVLVFKAAGPNSRVSACGLGSCSVCGKFLGKFPSSPFVWLKFIVIWSRLRDIVLVILLMFLVVDFFVEDLERTCPELKLKT